MYRDFKSFDQEIFNQELRTSLSSETLHDHTGFEENFVVVLNRLCSIKKVSTSCKPYAYVAEALRKAIMKKSFRKLYFKKKKKDKRIFEKV